MTTPTPRGCDGNTTGLHTCGLPIGGCPGPNVDTTEAILDRLEKKLVMSMAANSSHLYDMLNEDRRIARDHIIKLERDLAAAQEARDMHFARARSLTLDLSDAVGRYQRAEALAESLKADAERLAYLRSIAYRSYVGERRGDYWFLTALCADGGGADFIAAIDAERGKE